MSIVARRAVLVFVLPLVLAACREDAATDKVGAGLAAGSSSSPPTAPAAPTTGEPITDVVSHASETYDAGPPVLASGEVDGAELRNRHIERLKSDRSAVTVLRGNSALELGQRICEAVVPQRPKAIPILLKPNLCGFDGFKDAAKSGDDGVRGRITDPEFVRGVVRCLKARGHTKITIAEGCGNSHAHFQRAIRVSGYEAMAAAERVPLVAMDDDGVYDVEGNQPGKPLAISGITKSRVPTLLMPKVLAETLEHGLFISVPKLKAHRYSVVSLGIKGMQGTVMRSDASPAYNQKWRMHAELKDYLRARRNHEVEDRSQYVAQLELFAERMADVLEISLPDVVLVDGAPAMSGDGFQRLRSVPGMVALGGTNPVLVDRVGAEYLGLWDNAALARQLGGHHTSPLITVAARRYGIDLKAPELAGDGKAAFAGSRPVFFKAIAPFTLEGDQIIAPPPTSGRAPSTSSAAPSPTPARPVAHAARAPVRLEIDGRPEAAWRAAPPVSFETDYSGAATGIETSARFLWAESALFALFELSNTDLNVDVTFPTSRERPKLYQEDCVELFLAPDADRREHYFEVELGPKGHWFDIEVDRGRKLQRAEWSSGVTVVTTSDAAARTATIEARFTAPEFGAALKPGARLPFALFRMEGKAPRRYLAWSPPCTAKPNFHVPEAFGTLVIHG